MTKALAHVKPAPDGGFEVHDLDEHLRQVAIISRRFADAFEAGDWAFLSGAWHDLGKYRRLFQRYIAQASGYDADAHIEGKPGKVPHSTAGALLACQRLGKPGRVLAYLIASHHAGLYDWNSDQSSLFARLGEERAEEELKEALEAQPPFDVLTAHEGLDLDLSRVPGKADGFALWIRMLFSCLVDADFLDTEAFMDGTKAGTRSGYSAIPALLKCFVEYMEDFNACVAKQGPLSTVNRIRADVLAQCRARASEPPGLFTLTVPTGGGKTLSSLAFALEHAQRHGKQRVIYVIPYTSIIEQTADVFRRVFSSIEPDPVVEHHSNVDGKDSEESAKSRLACENWDAPIVVTTNVQFFESLFAARTSRCRKLHNLVNSVVVLDEAQMLPPEFLQPILDVLRLLTEHYGVTVVLSTATQPALASREYFDPQQNIRGLDNVRELMADGRHVRDPDDLYQALKRVDVTLPRDWQTPISWDALANELAGHDNVLCIVNRRKHARELFRRLPKGTLHLSALMCGAHRSAVIAEIKHRLKAGIPTRVVSTQLVEAGVDLDFPVVYRAVAGLDAIAQAAGRCNREGRQERGAVIVFVPPESSPPGLLLQGENASRNVLHDYSGDPLDRTLYARYFEHFYAACSLDQYGIGQLLKVNPKELAINFRTAAEKFRLIADEDTVPVIVRYRGPSEQEDHLHTMLGRLRKNGPSRGLLRSLQRYTVTIQRREAHRWAAAGYLEEWQPGCYVQATAVGYTEDLGLELGNDEFPSAKPLIA